MPARRGRHRLIARLTRDAGRVLAFMIFSAAVSGLAALAATSAAGALVAGETSDLGRAALGLAVGLLAVVSVAGAASTAWSVRLLFRRSQELRRARNVGVVLGGSALVGVLAGAGAIGFFALLELAKHLFLDQLAGFRPSGPAGEPPLFGHGDTVFRPWLLLLLPPLGGLLSGLIVFKLAPEAEGHGTDAAIDAYHHRQGAIRGRVPLVKAVASAITIGTGGSAGREGPIAQIGAGLGSVVASRLRLARRDRAVLLAAGLAGGIGAIFHAPLAGAIFAAEVMYREVDLEHEVIVPSFIASTVACSVFSLVFGWSPLFRTPGFTFENPVQLLPYLFLALVVGAGAVAFIRVFYGVRDAFASLRLPRPLKPALGGLVVGLVGLGVGLTGLVAPGTGVLGSGYGVLQASFFDAGSLGIAALLLVAVGKMVTTSFSIGSGGSGGVFGPSIVIGGALGGAVGLAAERLLPAADVHPGAFAMVGMAGFFAAAGHAPLSTIIMVGEMTGNYHLLVPSMLVCVVAFLLAGRHSIFEHQLPSRLDAPSKTANMMTGVLSRLPVRLALERDAGFVSVEPSTPLTSLLERFSRGEQECFPVVDDSGRLLGVVEGRSIRYVLAEDVQPGLVLAVDLAHEPVTVTPRDSLLTAIQRMAKSGRDQLVVVDADEPDEVLGAISHADVVASYNREVA